MKNHSAVQSEKIFSSSGNLKTHEIFHADEKPFNCSQCEKKFSQWQHLKTCERICTNEKPFSCSKCEKKFGHHTMSSNAKFQEMGPFSLKIDVKP